MGMSVSTIIGGLEPIERASQIAADGLDAAAQKGLVGVQLLSWIAQVVCNTATRVTQQICTAMPQATHDLCAAGTQAVHDLSAKMPSFGREAGLDAVRLLLAAGGAALVLMSMLAGGWLSLCTLFGLIGLCWTALAIYALDVVSPMAEHILNFVQPITVRAVVLFATLRSQLVHCLKPLLQSELQRRRSEEAVDAAVVAIINKKLETEFMEGFLEAVRPDRDLTSNYVILADPSFGAKFNSLHYCAQQDFWSVDGKAGCRVLWLNLFRDLEDFAADRGIPYLLAQKLLLRSQECVPPKLQPSWANFPHTFVMYTRGISPNFCSLERILDDLRKELSQMMDGCPPDIRERILSHPLNQRCLVSAVSCGRLSWQVDFQQDGWRQEMSEEEVDAAVSAIVHKKLEMDFIKHALSLSLTGEPLLREMESYAGDRGVPQEIAQQALEKVKVCRARKQKIPVGLEKELPVGLEKELTEMIVKLPPRVQQELRLHPLNRRSIVSFEPKPPISLTWA